MSRLLFAAAFLLVGCSKSDREPAPKTESPSKPPSWQTTKQPPARTTPTTSPEEKEFNDRVGEFVKEGRSVGRMLADVPDIGPYKRRTEDLATLLSKIPDPANSRQEGQRKFAQRVLATLELGAVNINLRDRFLGLKSEDGAKKADQACKDLSQKTRRYFDELEKAIREKRVPAPLESLDGK